MSLFDDFDRMEFGYLKEALDWAEQLEHAFNNQMPTLEPEEEEESPLWIGTGAAEARDPKVHGDETWLAVAIVESRNMLRDKRLQSVWNEILDVTTPFAVLEVGRINNASLAIGASVGVVTRGRSRGGTLGGAIADQDGCLGITAGHVLSPGRLGAGVEQPAAADGYPRTEIGHVVGFSDLQRKHNTADLGLIRIHADHDNGERVSLVEASMQDLGGMPVTKIGKATGTTSGRVTRVAAKGIGVLHEGRRKFFDGIFAVESNEGRFAWRGDSGSLVLDSDGGAVGMVVAVSATGGSQNQPLSWAIPTTSTISTMTELLS